MILARRNIVSARVFLASAAWGFHGEISLVQRVLPCWHPSTSSLLFKIEICGCAQESISCFYAQRQVYLDSEVRGNFLSMKNTISSHVVMGERTFACILKPSWSLQIWFIMIGLLTTGRSPLFSCMNTRMWPQEGRSLEHDVIQTKELV